MVQAHDFEEISDSMNKRNSKSTRKKKSDVPPFILSQILNPDFEGWLKVQGPKSALGQSMKNRWVLLKDLTLFVFEKDEQDSKVLELIKVRSPSSLPPFSPFDFVLP